jgi:hypothetical protein
LGGRVQITDLLNDFVFFHRNYPALDHLGFVNPIGIIIGSFLRMH